MSSINKHRYEDTLKKVWFAIRENSRQKDNKATKKERYFIIGEAFRHSSQLLDRWNVLKEKQQQKQSFEIVFREKLIEAANDGMRAVHIWWRWNDPMPYVNPNGSLFSMFIHPNPAVRKSLEKRRKMILRVFFRKKLPFDISKKIILEYLY